MLTPNKKMNSAVQAVLYIACVGTNTPVRSKEICQYQGVTLRYLEHILQQLVRDKILRGVRGPKGGYVLARDRRKISLADIYQCILPLVVDNETGTNDVLQLIIEPAQGSITEQHIAHLTTITLQDLYEKALVQKIDILEAARADFVI